MKTSSKNFNLHFVAGLAATVILPAALLAAAYRSGGMFVGAMSVYSLSAAIGVTLFWMREPHDGFSSKLRLEARVSQRAPDRLRKAA